MNNTSLSRSISAALLALVISMVASAQGFGGFSTPIFIALPSQSVDRIAVADVDQDGDNDILATISNPNSLGLFRNNGNGTFLQPQLFPADIFLDPIGGLRSATGTAMAFSTPPQRTLSPRRDSTTRSACFSTTEQAYTHHST